jgi:hypothetical protein
VERGVQTPSHLLIGLALRRAHAARRAEDAAGSNEASVAKAGPDRGLPASAAAWGSVAPDIPLYLLSVGGFAWFRGVLGWTPERTFERLYDVLFFQDPVWIASHNLLHAPLLLLAGLAFMALEGRWRRVAPDLAGVTIDAQVLERAARRRAWWSTFLLFCLVHAVIDVFTHYDDGPLVLFPFDWTTRFFSPVSYWDPDHFGRPFTFLEGLLDLVLLAWLLAPKLRRWRARREGRSP